VFDEVFNGLPRQLMESQLLPADYDHVDAGLAMIKSGRTLDMVEQLKRTEQPEKRRRT